MDSENLRQGLEITPSSLRNQLVGYSEGAASRYTNGFLAYYKKNHPKDYAALAAVLKQAEEAQESSVGLVEALAALDASLLEYYERSLVVASEVRFQLKKHGFNVEDSSINVRGANVNIIVECPGEDFRLTCLDSSIQGEEWLLNGVHYLSSYFVARWGVLEEVLEDVRSMIKALKKVQSGTLRSNSEEPFTISSGGLIMFDGKALENMFENTFEGDPVKLAALLNERYMAIVNLSTLNSSLTSTIDENAQDISNMIALGQLHMTNQRPQYVFSSKLDLFDAASALFQNTSNAYAIAKVSNFPESLRLEDEIRRQYEEIRRNWPGVTVASNSSVSSSAASSTAPAATAERPETQTREAFLASLSRDGWKKYGALSGDGDKGALNITGLDPGTSQYTLSRLPDFVGPSGAAMQLDPSEYVVTIDGTSAEWKIIPGYPNGTWVETDTEKRFWVKTGTKIEWKLKSDSVAAATAAEPTPAAESPATPAATPAAVVSAEAAAEVKPMSEKDLGLAATKLKNDAEVVTRLGERRVGLLAEKDRPFSSWRRIGRKLAEVDADIALYSESVATLTKKISEQRGNPAYALVIAKEFSDADARMALGLPDPLNETVG